MGETTVYRSDSTWIRLVLVVVVILTILAVVKAELTRRERQEAGSSIPWFALAGAALLLMLAVFVIQQTREAHVRTARAQALSHMTDQAESIAELHERLNQPRINLVEPATVVPEAPVATVVEETPVAVETILAETPPTEQSVQPEQPETPQEKTESAEEETKPAKSKPSANRPDWVNAPPKRIGDVNRRVVSAGPYRTIDECYESLERPLLLAVTQHLEHLTGTPSNRQWPLHNLGINYETILREFCTEEYIEPVDSPTVGEMKRLHVLVEFGPAQDALLINQWKATERNERLFHVVFGASLVLGTLMLVFGLLKLDTATRGYYSKRLFLGVPAAIIVIMGVLALFA